MRLRMPATANASAGLGRKEGLTKEMKNGPLGGGTPNQVN